MTEGATMRACLLSLAVAAIACRGSQDPRPVLEEYFGSAMRGDYAATYGCYDDADHAKVSRDEYVRHRREASTLQAYQIVSLKTKGGAARALVRLTFAPSEKLHRRDPVTTTVQEDLVRQPDGWRIRVW